MNKHIRLLLNIKPAEIAIVKQLFLVQFFLGVATAFLFIGSLTMFLTAFDSRNLPLAYIGAAILLLVANTVYARLEKHFSPQKLLLVIILFSVASIFGTWLGATFFDWHWLPFFLAAWNLVVYMLVGYAFWGMAAIIFNVRESKRLFTIVGSGDIPAKMLGYVAVAVLVPVIGVANLLWISIASFLVAYFLLYRSKSLNTHISHDENHHHQSRHNTGVIYNFVKRLFEHRLIFILSLWSVVAFAIFAIIDFTFLIEIKARYTTQHELAAFIGVFFTIGRFLAIIIKVSLSSRLISRFGLANSLLISPVILLGITCFILMRGEAIESHLYIFGVMVLVSEILKSVVQDPVFFVLFQPLKPHLRLKGHLIAKGYTLPFALMGAGIFLAVYLRNHEHIPIALIAQTLVVLLIGWIFTVFLIKKEYLTTLVTAIQKGYFTGTELFINNKPIRNLLIEKTKSQNPKEIIYALDLLERSGYKKLKKLWLNLLPDAPDEVKIFILNRLVSHNTAEALPVVQKLLTSAPALLLKLNLIKTFYFLQPAITPEQQDAFNKLDLVSKKAALIGLLLQPESSSSLFAQNEMLKFTDSSLAEDKILAIDIVTEVPTGNYTPILTKLLADDRAVIYKKAIIAICKTKDFDLLPAVIQKVTEFNLYPVWQQAILQASDEIYGTSYLMQNTFAPEVTKSLIQAAGKLKGEYSDQFLLKQLQQELSDTNLIIEALWSKKTAVPGISLKPLENWLQAKLKQTHLKIYYFKSLNGSQVSLLIAALKSEIEQDLQIILKAFALLYDRTAVDRVIHLYQYGDANSFSNAVEMLEIILPKRYFAKTDSILEFLYDVRRQKPVDFHQKVASLEDIITDILTQNKAACNSWTKATAYYIIPGLESRSVFKNLLQNSVPNDNNYLLKETREFVNSLIA